MALFGSPKPVVLKEGSAAEEQLRQMEDAKGTLGPRAEARLEKDLRLVRAGIDGERRILYELKNSHMDMFILQDLSWSTKAHGPKPSPNDRYARRDVKAQVIRADQLIETIKRINNEKGPGSRQDVSLRYPRLC